MGSPGEHYALELRSRVERPLLVARSHSDDIDERVRPRIMGISTPLNWRWFFSPFGCECCHTYLWIVKDLAWMQGWMRMSVLFGLLALAWSLQIMYHALRTENIHEAWNSIAVFLWLFANFWWMSGEAHDYEYWMEFPVSAEHADVGAHVLQFAFCWVLTYYLVFVPLNLFPLSRASLAEYDDGRIQPRCGCFFRNFRQYENFHMLLWIMKDLAWNRLYLEVWYITLVPTVIMAADFMYLAATSGSEDAAIEFVHYAVTFVWVIGNSIWAYGDFFIEDYDTPLHMFSATRRSLKTPRWYSSWILFLDLLPILYMYALWGMLTYSGYLHFTAEEKEAMGKEYYSASAGGGSGGGGSAGGGGGDHSCSVDGVFTYSMIADDGEVGSMQIEEIDDRDASIPLNKPEEASCSSNLGLSRLGSGCVGCSVGDVEDGDGRREGSELWPSVGLGADLQQDMLLEAEYHRNRFQDTLNADLNDFDGNGSGGGGNSVYEQVHSSRNGNTSQHAHYASIFDRISDECDGGWSTPNSASSSSDLIRSVSNSAEPNLFQRLMNS